MVVATRSTSVLYRFGWEFRIDEEVSICSSARLAWSLGVCSLWSLIVHTFSSIESGVVGLPVHMGKNGLGIFLHGSMAGVQGGARVHIE